MHYCYLLDTLGDHEGMLNCAIMHVTKTFASETPLRSADENLQRDMFAVACKKYITARLEQWRILRDRKSHIQSNSLGVRLKSIKQYLDDFESNLLAHIYEIIQIVDEKLIPNCQVEENRVFYYKMLADYFRYTVDFHGKDETDKYMGAVSEALGNYKYAMELGQRHLEPTSPIYLALVLNYSVFIYDMQNNVAGAIDTAQFAFDDAIQDVHELKEEQHKESTLLLQLLRDNLQLWKHAASMDTGGDFRDPGLNEDEPEMEPEPE